jgi:hypothetical protein
LPSLPVRGFGDDGLLVTGGVGSSSEAVARTVTGEGASTGLLGFQRGAAVVGAVWVQGAPTAMQRRKTISAVGAQVGLLGVQHAIATTDGGMSRRNRNAVLFALDEDLLAA